MVARIGLNGKIYRQTTGTRATWPGSGAAPNLDEIANVRDVSVNLEAGTADVSTRAMSWEQALATQKKGSIEFEMVANTTDLDFDALVTAFTAGTVIALALLNAGSTTVGTRGLWADFVITGMEESQPLDGATVIKFRAQLGSTAVAPEYVTVA